MSVAACPRCEGQITLPPGAPPTAQVKCPLCEEEFALSEVYDKLPPMLVLLEAPVEARTGAEGGMFHGAGEFDNLFVPSADANGEGELHLSPADGEEGESTFDFGGSGGGTAVATAPATKAAARASKRPPKSPVKEGIKIVLGGIVGLAAGYLILLWGFNRDLCSDVAGKPVAKVLPAWMHWALPAAHKPAAPAAAAPAADDDPSEAGEDTPDADSPDADPPASQSPNDGDDASPTDDGTTGPDGAASDASDDASQSPPEDASKSPTGEGSDDASASPPSDDMPSDVTTEDKPADVTTPKQPAPRANDDGGFEIKPTQPSFEVDEPPLDFPPPSAVPPVDEPKLTDPLPGDQPLTPTDEPPVVDAPGDEPPPSDPPSDPPGVEEPKVATPAETPADAPADDNPFDIPPGTVDPADQPEVTPADAPTDEPAEPAEPEPAEPAEPKAGLKVDQPVDDATVVSTRSAATSAVDGLMPEDPAAKAAFTREKYASYTKLCEFADSVSRVAVVENDPNVAAASAMLQMIVADDTDTRSLGQLANAWLSKKRANDGIALAGKVTAVATAGGLTTITVELPALEGRLEARSATIVTREDATIAEGDEVSAVGTVVEKPTDEIVGYSGADTQVIWGAWVGRRGG